MSEKLQIVATQLLSPETKDGPSSLLIVLGMPPREATVAYIVNSRAQIADLFHAIGPQVEDGQIQNILTTIQSIESFPEESEEPGVVLEDESAQAALDTLEPDEDDDGLSEKIDEQEGINLN